MLINSFSNGHSNYLRVLKDGIQKSHHAVRFFPKGMSTSIFDSFGGVAANTDFQKWIDDLVVNSGLNINNFLVESNLFCLTKIVYDGSHLSHVSVQVVYAEKDIVFNGTDNQFIYQRFDHHQCALGKFLREPFVHSHVGYHDELRYKYYLSDGQNSFISFWDFLYRTFYYSSWVRWMSPIAKRSLGSSSLNKYDEIVNLYDNSLFGKLERYRHQIKGIKKAIRTAHWRLFEFDIDHRLETFHL